PKSEYPRQLATVVHGIQFAAQRDRFKELPFMRKGEKASPARIGARMPTMAQLQFQFFGTFKKADGWYIAHCPPLDVTTQGKTLAEAKRNLIEASELFIISCLERGTLDLALRELGFVGPIKGRIPAMPANAFSFLVPI